MRGVGLLLAVLAMAACGNAGPTLRAATPSATPSATPVARSGPRVEMPSGAIYALELARTPEEQAQGLMFRESLPERSGMLFPFADASVHKFWMKNTMIALDMIWLDGAGKVLFVSANTPPCRADPCPNYGPDTAASSVLEIAGGKAEKEKVTVGATLRFSGVK